jgi:hypothetical protein
MDSQALQRTRLSLHGLAELVLAGPQYVASHDIRLRVTPGGFGTVTTPDLRVDHVELVTPTTRLPLGGTYADLARAVGVEPRALRDVYADGPGVGQDDVIVIDPVAAGVVLEAFARGAVAMQGFAPDQQPVLWPEHFDIGISVDEVNYGVSPGDVHIPEPYAYVGPWHPRVGAFWNTGFGAARTLEQLGDVDALEGFFEEGARRARADSPGAP